MKRVQVWTGAIPLEVDILNGQKNTMVAIGHVLQDMLGTSTLFSGLGCVPTAPAGMTVNVNPGRAYSYQVTDAGAYSSLAADSHMLMKQGIVLDATNFSCPAPTTAGFSINYLVQGAFQEVDGGATVLPFYNASNPAQAYNGPNGTGASSNTYRDNTVQLSLKAGAAATTGSQITPTPDAGFNGLWVITVPYGATSITSGNISQYSGAPFLTADLLTQVTGRALLAGSSSQVFSAANGASGNQVVNYSQFGASLATSGYTKLPNGLIVQWGTASVTAPFSGYFTSLVNFPLAFPNAAYMSMATFGGTAPPQVTNSISSTPNSLSQLTVAIYANQAATTYGINYIAFGK